MVATVSGYAGGRSEKPTYRSIGDHTEAVLVYFDPEVVSYERLLSVFVKGHDPFAESGPRQYRNVVLAADEEQLKSARELFEGLEARAGDVVMTDVERLGDFTPAEDYHQKYYLKGMAEIYGALRNLYPSEADFAASTAAARLNGYAGYNGSPETFRREAGKLGLTQELQSLLEKAVLKRLR